MWNISSVYSSTIIAASADGGRAGVAPRRAASNSRWHYNSRNGDPREGWRAKDEGWYQIDLLILHPSSLILLRGSVGGIKTPVMGTRGDGWELKVERWEFEPFILHPSSFTPGLVGGNRISRKGIAGRGAEGTALEGQMRSKRWSVTSSPLHLFTSSSRPPTRSRTFADLAINPPYAQ